LVDLHLTGSPNGGHTTPDPMPDGNDGECFIRCPVLVRGYGAF
jgi:hypothetical protein